jgi:hypothetical protein
MVDMATGQIVYHISAKSQRNTIALLITFCAHRKTQNTANG